MNCHECREETAAYLEGLLEQASQSQMELHIAGCSACRAELEAVRQLVTRLACDGLGESPVLLEAAVMDSILYRQAPRKRKFLMRSFMGLAVSAAVAVMILWTWDTTSDQHSLYAQIIRSMRNARSLHKTTYAQGKDSRKVGEEWYERGGRVSRRILSGKHD